MRFCVKNDCNNVLTTIGKAGGIIYRCMVCFEEYPLSDTDTLLIDEYLQEGNTVHKYRSYLQNAHADSIVELVEKKCPAKGCSETIVNAIKIDQSGQLLHICPTCKRQFA